MRYVDAFVRLQPGTIFCDIFGNSFIKLNFKNNNNCIQFTTKRPLLTTKHSESLCYCGDEIEKEILDIQTEVEVETDIVFEVKS